MDPSVTQVSSITFKRLVPQQAVTDFYVVMFVLWIALAQFIVLKLCV